MKELVKDTTNRNLGFRHHKCRICDNEGEFQSWLVREMMYGTKDEFEYFECPGCKCMQISEVPKDLGNYYMTDYYSFSENKTDPESFPEITRHESLLDVGCGTGKLLLELAFDGYGHLFGCDPFIESDIKYGDRIFIRKCEIKDIEGEKRFDIVNMGDSLEHVLDPIDTLKHVNRLLKDDGKAVISVPTWPNAAFDIFQTHWYQLDAPRHIFIPSKECMRYIADRAGLNVVNVLYNSGESQFITSFFYEHNIPFVQLNNDVVMEYFSFEEIQDFRRITLMVNKEQNGDHMIVELRKRGE